jgi:hypothetical protein
MWKAIDDDGELLEALNETMSRPIESPVSSTLLDTQQLEELETFISRQQGVTSISSLDVFKQQAYDMQGLSTQACKAFVVLEVFKYKDEALQ